MFGVQFYPTPESLVKKMMDLVNWERVQFALEPSAGKGDIAQGIRERMKVKQKPLQLDCVEIDPDLRELNQYKELGDLDRLRELVEADKEGRCAVLPMIERECITKFRDDLKDVFSEWSYEDRSAGIFGMNESEKQLAEAIIAALEKEENRNG